MARHGERVLADRRRPWAGQCRCATRRHAAMGPECGDERAGAIEPGHPCPMTTAASTFLLGRSGVGRALDSRAREASWACRQGHSQDRGHGTTGCCSTSAPGIDATVRLLMGGNGTILAVTNERAHGPDRRIRVYQGRAHEIRGCECPTGGQQRCDDRAGRQADLCDPGECVPELSEDRPAAWRESC